LLNYKTDPTWNAIISSNPGGSAFEIFSVWEKKKSESKRVIIKIASTYSAAKDSQPACFLLTMFVTAYESESDKTTFKDAMTTEDVHTFYIAASVAPFYTVQGVSLDDNGAFAVIYSTRAWTNHYINKIAYITYTGGKFVTEETYPGFSIAVATV